MLSFRIGLWEAAWTKSSNHCLAAPILLTANRPFLLLLSALASVECFQLHKNTWADSERTLRPLSGPASFHIAVLSHQDQGWLSCARALHFLALRSVSLGCQLLSTFCLLAPYPRITSTYPILSSLLSSTPPRHEYILNGTWHRHQNLPCGLSLQVYTQYPRPEVFLMTSPFFLHAFVHSQLPSGLIRNLFRLACLQFVCTVPNS